jgi:DNA-binding IclR family transcriptional regulator
MSTSDRVLSILALFSVERHGWTVEQAAEALGQPVSTTYRHFAVLTKAGLIEPVGAGRYLLGPAAIQLDWLIRQTDPLLAAARPAMEILSGAIDHPAVILLCRLYRGQVMCVAQAVAANPNFASGYQRGRPMPLTRGAASKVILAHLSDRAIRSLLAQKPAEFVEGGLGANWQQVRASLATIKDEGYSITSGEVDRGLTGIAAPILQADGSPIGCICYVVVGNRLEATFAASLVRLLKAAAGQISASLSPSQQEASLTKR